MQLEAGFLPDLVETIVLHRMLLVRSDELPDLAARWLAADVVDTASVRLLAGHDRHDPSTLEELLVASAFEAGVEVPTDSKNVQRIVKDWVRSTWKHTRDTRWAVATLARIGATNRDFDLGYFIGLDDEWSGSWGRLDDELEQAGIREFERLSESDTRDE